MISASATAGRAQDGIYNVVHNFSSLGSGSPNDPDVSADFEINDTAVAGPNQSFTARYGFNVNADSKSTGRSKMAQAVHEVSFQVHSTRGYTLRISTGWVGEMRRTADTLGCAGGVTLSGVTGQVVAGFDIRTGSLSLPDPPDITLLTSDDQDVQLSDVADATIQVTNPSPTEFHTLRFSWEAGVLSDTCETAVRLGGSSGTTTECFICGYPGDPVRDQNFDGHFVFVEYVPSNCGNGQLDSDEECDLGSGNGFGACCTVFCKKEPVDMPCTGDGLFCHGDGRCDAAGVCQQPFGNPCITLPDCAVCDEDLNACVPCATPTVTPQTTATSTPPPSTATATSTAPPSTATATSTAPPSTATATATATAPSGTATATATGSTERCPGDCNGDGHVIVNELVTGVNIALENASIDTCPAFDRDGDRLVIVNELVLAVSAALQPQCVL